MNEYFQLDFHSNELIAPGIYAENHSIRCVTVPGLVLAATRFCDDYGDCAGIVWHWKAGVLVEDPVFVTVNEFVETLGKGVASVDRLEKIAAAARKELAEESGK